MTQGPFWNLLLGPYGFSAFTEPSSLVKTTPPPCCCLICQAQHTISILLYFSFFIRRINYLVPTFFPEKYGLKRFSIFYILSLNFKEKLLPYSNSLYCAVFNHTVVPMKISKIAKSQFRIPRDDLETLLTSERLFCSCLSIKATSMQIWEGLTPMFSNVRAV